MKGEAAAAVPDDDGGMITLQSADKLLYIWATKNERLAQANTGISTRDRAWDQFLSREEHGKEIGS